MEVRDTYRGREHSLIKHELLKGYLQRLLLILGVSAMRNTGEVTYVDCFAGPWGPEDESMEGTSIAISLNILKTVKDSLIEKHGITGLKFRAIYVEQNRARYCRLKGYLENNAPDGIECHSLRGDYSELQEEILAKCGKGFAFFFLDPKGWKDVTISKLRKLAERPQSEFLINFMYEFFNRFKSLPELRHQVVDILGELDESDWVTLESRKPTEREAWVVDRYRERLKLAVGCQGNEKARAYHAVIKDKDVERTKYHMVYVTRHPKGIIVFAEQSESVSFVQKVVRIQTAQAASNQFALFSAEDEASRDDTDRVDMGAVETYWLQLLDTVPRPFDEAVLADMLEETGWQILDIQQAFRNLLLVGKVENIDAPRIRPKHAVHFDKAERLRKVR